MSDQLLDSLRQSLSHFDADQMALVERAYDLAAQAHEGQKRHSGEPYIIHPVAVAMILARMGLDVSSIVAGLLHDTIEDTTLTKERIEDVFGEEVASMVDGLSKLDRIKFHSKVDEQAENFRKMFMAMSKDIRVMIVKLADRLHNMRTLQPFRADKRKRIAKETLDIYAPIARRLGMHDISRELEDLSFAAYYPLRYRILQEAVTRLQGVHVYILDEIKAQIARRMQEYGISFEQITGREKHLYSIYRKMLVKRRPFSDITDVYAVRIIVDDIDTCYRTLGVVHNLYKPIAKEFMDYIAQPKPNNYQSLHTGLFGPYGVPVEVQIRTKDMHQIASVGIASHAFYKVGEHAVDEATVRVQKWCEGLVDIQKNTWDSQEFLENVKVDLFPDEIYVFTPTGDIIELPAGATAMDFAYAIHAEIGNTCVACRVDRQLTSLSTALKSGQTVEIINSPSARPKSSWLNTVVTAKARSNIRHYLKSQQRNQSVSLGYHMLVAAMGQDGLSEAVLVPGVRRRLVDDFGVGDFDDVLEQIGLGTRPARLTVENMKRNLEDELLQAAESPGPVGQTSTTQSKPVLVTGAEGLVVSCAVCCYPVPGDVIIGVIQKGSGVEIHRECCHHARQMVYQDTDDAVPLSWSAEVSGEFLAHLSVHVLNQRGVLAMLALAISDAKGNIEDISISDYHDSQATVSITLFVKGRDHLAEIIKGMRSVPAVVRVKRPHEGS